MVQGTTENKRTRRERKISAEKKGTLREQNNVIRGVNEKEWVCGDGRAQRKRENRNAEKENKME